MQRDHVLLVQGTCTEGAYADVVRAVVPDYVVLQLWIRDGPAIRVAGRAGHNNSGWTSRGEIRSQNRAVLDGHDSGGLGSRGRAAVGRAGLGRRRAG